MNIFNSLRFGCYGCVGRAMLREVRVVTPDEIISPTGFAAKREKLLPGGEQSSDWKRWQAAQDYVRQHWGSFKNITKEEWQKVKKMFKLTNPTPLGFLTGFMGSALMDDEEQSFE